MNATPENNDAGLPALSPLRGIITAANARGVSHDRTTLRKWIRLNSRVYKTNRIDLRMTEREARAWPALVEFARRERLRLSLRTPAKTPPAAMNTVLDGDPHDVCLESTGDDTAALARWLDTLEERDIPARVVLLAAPDLLGAIEDLSDPLERAKAVTIAAFDPFFSAPSATDEMQGLAILHEVNTLAGLLAAAGVDVSLVGFPFCHIEGDNLDRALNSSQYFLDHLQYHWASFQFAECMFRHGSRRVAAAIENLLGRKSSIHTRFDDALFPWIEGQTRLLFWMWARHKLTRHLRFLAPKPRPLPETESAYDAALQRYREERQRTEGPICTACRYKRVCDGHTPAFQERFPGVAITAVPGEPLAAAPCQTRPRRRYYDALDAERARLPKRLVRLAEETQRLLLETPPTREISPDDYEIVGRYTHHMPGAVRWLSFVRDEFVSTVLARVEPPFTLSFTVGGGIATHAGVSFGRHARIVCPLIDYSHRLTLAVDADGYYALLRDGQIVRPTEFEAATHVPPRLGSILEPRLNLHNIDGMILTQAVSLWEGPQPLRETADDVKYSIVIINTRYTRRLQAALLSLAHQQGVPDHLFEVIIAYVPGIDATDDLIDNVMAAYPRMRLVRFPVAEGLAHSKGFMINESMRAVSGKRVLLMDADILLPPDLFLTLEAITEDHPLIAPEGRKMLPPDVTANILLNEVQPWRQYEELLNGPGELRTREAVAIPIGFFQCVRRDVLARIPYHELDHFEASDWHFGREVTELYGPEYRMINVYVLHLDHGGSQWYGTHKHR